MAYVTLPDRVHNVKGMLRFLRRRGDVAAIWDEPWHKDLVEGFATVCFQSKAIDLQGLLSIHPDDLKVVFDDLKVPVDHRIVIRRYLNLPHVTFANLWTACQIAFTVVVVLVKVLRFAFRPIVWKLGVAVGVSALLASQMSVVRFRRVLRTLEAQASRDGASPAQR